MKVLNRYRELEIKKVLNRITTEEENEFGQIKDERKALLEEYVSEFVEEK